MKWWEKLRDATLGNPMFWEWVVIASIAAAVVVGIVGHLRG